MLLGNWHYELFGTDLDPLACRTETVELVAGPHQNRFAQEVANCTCTTPSRTLAGQRLAVLVA
jgi:hypothetical protein